MDWLENLNRAMDYIEGHLEGEISYDRAAQLAGCSKYHLLRMFPYLTGVSLSEYIRRRRLTLAAFALQDGGLKVIDAALQYGYESPEAFSRAFKALHGVSPDQAKRGGGALAAYPRMSFHISVKGENQMKYRMTHREGFRVFGVWAEVSSDMQAAFQQVPAFCRRCDEDGTVDKLNHLLGRFSDNYTLSALYGHTEDSFRYMLCNFLPQGLALPEGFTVLEVPETDWAVFDVPGCEMQKVWPRVYSEWFPDSGYELAQGPQFEMYYGLAGHQNAFGEIWVPVRKK